MMMTCSSTSTFVQINLSILFSIFINACDGMWLCCQFLNNNILLSHKMMFTV